MDEISVNEATAGGMQTSTDWLGLALESTAHTLLIRRPGDPDAGIHAAIDSFASQLDIESVVLYRLGHDNALRCLAAWSRGNHVLTGSRRASIVDPLLGAIRDKLVVNAAGATRFEELDQDVLAALGQWGETTGSLASVPTVADGRQVGGITVVIRDDRAWRQEHFRALDDLALALHFFVERCEAENTISRQSELDSLRSKTTSLFLEPIVEEEDASERIGLVLSHVAEVFNADLVTCGNRAQFDHQLPGTLFRGSSGAISPMAIKRLMPRTMVDDLHGVLHLRLDDDAHQRLGLSDEEAPTENTLVVITRVEGVNVGGLALVYLGPIPVLTSVDADALREVNGHIHQFQTGVQQRRSNARHTRLDRMRRTLAETLIEQPPKTISELIHTSFPIIGEALGADVLLFRPASDTSDGIPRIWADPEAIQRFGHVPNRRRLYESMKQSLDRADTKEPTNEDAYDSEIRAQLEAIGVSEFTLYRANVSDTTRDATLSAAGEGHRDWGAAEQAALVSAGTLIQQMVDTIHAREILAVHDELDDLTHRCAAALIHRGGGDHGISDVLTEIGTYFDAGYVVWVQGHKATRSLRASHWWPSTFQSGDITNLEPATWKTLVDNLHSPQISSWAAAPAEIQTRIPSDAEARHLMVPVVAAEEQITILDVEIGDYEYADVALRSLETIAGMIWEVQRRTQATELFTTTFQSAPTGQAMLDDAGIVTNVNNALLAMLGDVVGERWADLDAGWDDEQRSTAPRELLLAYGGVSVWTRLRSSDIPTANGGSLTLVHIEDISVERANRAELEYQANHDQLTGLGNRHTLGTRLATVLNDGPATLFMLDIDRFKVVNDSLGHAAGDRVLTTIADRLRMAVRARDVVCRFGGDEFTIIVPGEIDQFEIASLASRISELVRAPIELEKTSVVSTTSIGIAHGLQHTDPSSLLRHADAALYSAKTNGRQRYEFFDAADSASVRDRLDLQSGLRQAVRDSEFTAWYQPEYDLTTGAILGVEALVRWDRPGHGIVPAYEFIEDAEEMGLAPAFSTQVLQEACAALRTWLDDGHDLHVRVNVAAVQLQGDLLAADIDAALSLNGLDPRHLCLEVTERSLLVDIEAATQSLGRIRDLGIEVAIDDFGTGFSSLAWLKQLPVDTLKIDRAFVTGLETDNVDREIVRTIMALAKVLSLDVVAEGVEHEGQAEILRSLGCERAQGWLWSPAVPAAEITALLRARTTQQ